MTNEQQRSNHSRFFRVRGLTDLLLPGDVECALLSNIVFLGVSPRLNKNVRHLRKTSHLLDAYIITAAR